MKTFYGNFSENTEKGIYKNGGKIKPLSNIELEEEKTNNNINSSLNYENKSSSVEDNNIFDSSLENRDDFLYGNDFSQSKTPLQLGNTRNSLYINGSPIISIGKNILIPLLLILFVCIIYLLIWFYFLGFSGYLMKKMFNFCFLIYIISHILSIFINPGIPSFKYHKTINDLLKKIMINELDVTKCKMCNLTHKLIHKISHCDKCNICYYEYDHHCTWTGHCVGMYNKYFFGIFILSLFFFILICFASIFVAIIKVIVI